MNIKLDEALVLEVLRALELNQCPIAKQLRIAMYREQVHIVKNKCHRCADRGMVCLDYDKAEWMTCPDCGGK